MDQLLPDGPGNWQASPIPILAPQPGESTHEDPAARQRLNNPLLATLEIAQRQRTRLHRRPTSVSTRSRVDSPLSARSQHSAAVEAEVNRYEPQVFMLDGFVEGFDTFIGCTRDPSNLTQLGLPMDRLPIREDSVRQVAREPITDDENEAYWAQRMSWDPDTPIPTQDNALHSD